MKPLKKKTFTYREANLANKTNKDLIEEIRNYNSFISQNLNEIEKNFNSNKIKEEELTKEIDSKQKLIDDLKNQIKSKDEELLYQKELNKKLIDENKNLSGEIDELKSKINTLDDEKDELNEEINNLNYKIDELNKKIEEMENKIKNIKNNESEYKDKNFENLKEIYKGAYSNIYSAYSTKDNIDLCLKKIDINVMEHQYNNSGYPENNHLKDLNNEIEILKLLSPYENSVKYYGDYQIIKEKNIVMEKCDEDFETYIKNINKPLKEEEIRNIFIGLNKVFKVMYEKDIIHRDLKLKNFLIKYKNKEKTEFIVKLADYGIGKFLSKEKYIFSGMKGTLETIAPEIYLQKTEIYESSVDIFSLGVILYQLSHNLKHPFKSKENENLIFTYCKYYETDNFKIIFDPLIGNEDFKDLVNKMLKLNPKNRITWDQYFLHQFFKIDEENDSESSSSENFQREDSVERDSERSRNSENSDREDNDLDYI